MSVLYITCHSSVGTKKSSYLLYHLIGRCALSVVQCMCVRHHTALVVSGF